MKDGFPTCCMVIPASCRRRSKPVVNLHPAPWPGRMPRGRSTALAQFHRAQRSTNAGLERERFFCRTSFIRTSPGRNVESIGSNELASIPRQSALSLTSNERIERIV